MTTTPERDEQHATEEPTSHTPGEVLEEEFLTPMGLTQTALADRMGVAVQQINLIVRGRRAITPATAIMLSRALDTSPEFWMNLQTNYDLGQELQRERKRA
ncbi:MAG TPA: HigA family addiction module antitoxin [Polyangiaceae bacterium]|nr:HigA family addiction module antitoxin [Polyangiaceae bacterium]